MYKIAHLSDPHLGPLPGVSPRQLAGKRMFGYLNWLMGRNRIHQPRLLNRIVKDIRRQKVDHIALTGDLVNISLAGEFVQAASWLAQVGKPEHVTLVPGNHDAYVDLPPGEGYDRWAHYMTSNRAGKPFAPPHAPSFPFVRKLGEIALIGLSSAIPTWPFMASGALGEEQLSVLPKILRALAEKDLFRVVLMHHPPLPGLTSARRALNDADKLSEILAQEGAELVLYGHNHTQAIDMLEGASDPIPVVGAPSASSAGTSSWPLARYNCFHISQSSKGWTCQMIGRGLSEPSGKVKKLEHIWLKA